MLGTRFLSGCRKGSRAASVRREGGPIRQRLGPVQLARAMVEHPFIAAPVLKPTCGRNAGAMPVMARPTTCERCRRPVWFSLLAPRRADHQTIRPPTNQKPPYTYVYIIFFCIVYGRICMFMYIYIYINIYTNTYGGDSPGYPGNESKTSLL